MNPHVENTIKQMRPLNPLIGFDLMERRFKEGITKNNTKITRVRPEPEFGIVEHIIVTLHDADVVTVCEDLITLNTGGWATATTVCRMNQAARQGQLGFIVRRCKGDVLVTQRPGGEEHPMMGDVMTFPRWQGPGNP